MVEETEKFLFPDCICPFCGAEKGECECERRISLIEPHACPKCGRHRTDRACYGLCGSCRESVFFFDANYSAAYYEGVLKQALMDFKYRRALYFRRILGDLLYEKYLYEKRHLPEISLLTYIPVSLTRRLGRGYNQAGELAKVFSERSGIPLLPLLVRTKRTRRLKDLSKKERESELKDSMRVREKYLTIMPENKILVIDDIFTTGATVNEAARCLKTAGAQYVCSFTVATR